VLQIAQVIALPNSPVSFRLLHFLPANVRRRVVLWNNRSSPQGLCGARISFEEEYGEDSICSSGLCLVPLGYVYIPGFESAWWQIVTPLLGGTRTTASSINSLDFIQHPQRSL
jgi:hypothetical protein